MGGWVMDGCGWVDGCGCLDVRNGIIHEPREDFLLKFVISSQKERDISKQIFSVIEENEGTETSILVLYFNEYSLL